MKTVSNYLFDLYKSEVKTLVGVANTTVDLTIQEPAVFLPNGSIGSLSQPSELRIFTEFYFGEMVPGFVDAALGSLEVVACAKLTYPVSTARLAVTILAKPGKETQDILEILKENFK